ncbi:hypothetical protein SFR_1339 [Streptomyces sp. FR-008]|nr:hypothetical protein SFR_1339 [Streptomyces sp. FR-008]
MTAPAPPAPPPHGPHPRQGCGPSRCRTRIARTRTPDLFPIMATRG